MPVQQLATSDTYTTGYYAGEDTKVDPFTDPGLGGLFEQNGFFPDDPLAAQHLNWLLSRLLVGSIDIGTGVDGPQTITTTVNLSAPLHATDITISGAGILNTNGWPVHWTGTFDVTAATTPGAIRWAANPGAAGSSYSVDAAGGTAGTAGMFAAGLAGGAGSASGAGTASAAQPNAISDSISGRGGRGGTGGADGGGTPGAAGGDPPAPSINRYTTGTPLGFIARGGSIVSGAGQGGGGGGAGDDVGASSGGTGGGGGAGGNKAVFRGNIFLRGASTAAGLFSYVGGTGGAGQVGQSGSAGHGPGGGAGGGGGSGAEFDFACQELQGAVATNVVDLSGGPGGAGGTGGVAAATFTGGSGGQSGQGGAAGVAILNLAGAKTITHGGARTSSNSGSAGSGVNGGAGGAQKAGAALLVSI